MIDNKKDASIKKDRAIFDFIFSATNDLDFFEERINYRMIGVEKFRYKCTGCVILNYTGPRTDFLVLYYGCKYVNYDDNTVLITNITQM